MNHQNYSASVHDSKPYRLAQLQQLAEQQIGALKSHYNADNRTGVVKTTISKLTSATTGGGSNSDRTVRHEGALRLALLNPKLLALCLREEPRNPMLGSPSPPTMPSAPINWYEEESTGQTIMNTGEMTNKLKRSQIPTMNISIHMFKLKPKFSAPRSALWISGSPSSCPA